MEGYVNVLEGSRPMLGRSIRYMEGSKPMLECLNMMSMYPTGHPSMALDSYVTSMYPTRYPAWPWTRK
jgi:hypothetical protein